jgi:rare lipoprotein A (peptidoglycan hydrolase)
MPASQQHPKTGRSVKVRVNDRGPFTKGVSLDLSHGAARAIGMRVTQSVALSVQPELPLNEAKFLRGDQPSMSDAHPVERSVEIGGSRILNLPVPPRRLSRSKT